MTPEERTLITGLFDRLKTADASTPSKDADADSLIRQLATANPSAPYLLTQTVLVHEHALANAQARIQALEQQAAQAQKQAAAGATAGGGGFLSGLFGSHGSTTTPVPQAPPPLQPAAPPYPSTVNMPPSAGGGFLRNALTTAAGVAGGAMLFQGIENLLGHNSGPFGSFGGGGSFLGNRPEIIENNYYGDSGSSHGGGSSGGDSVVGDDQGFTGSAELDGPSGIPADQPTLAGSEDQRYDDSGFDSSNPFDKATDSEGLFGARDDSSMDNNYDAQNDDAFSGGGDNDDSGGGYA